MILVFPCTNLFKGRYYDYVISRFLLTRMLFWTCIHIVVSGRSRKVLRDLTGLRLLEPFLYYFFSFSIPKSITKTKPQPLSPNHVLSQDKRFQIFLISTTVGKSIFQLQVVCNEAVPSSTSTGQQRLPPDSAQLGLWKKVNGNRFNKRQKSAYQSRGLVVVVHCCANPDTGTACGKV